MHETMTDVEVMELLGLDETSFAHVIRIGDLVPVREHPRMFDSQAVREYQTEINRESAAFHDLMTIQKELGLYKYTSEQLVGGRGNE